MHSPAGAFPRAAAGPCTGFREGPTKSNDFNQLISGTEREKGAGSQPAKEPLNRCHAAPSFTSLVLFAALLGGCSASTDAAEGAGGTTAVDPASDNDNDNVPAANDKCPESTADGWTDAQGCGESQDGDGDGVPTDQDLCPDTPAGEPVDGTGCSASQDPNGGSGATAGSGGSAGGGSATPGKDGQVAPNGFASFTLDPKGKLPVSLETLAKNVKDLATGFQIDGSLLVQLPDGQQLVLAEAHMKLEYDSAKGEGLQSVSGTCRVPFPAFGLGDNASFDDLVYASIGWDLGKNIQNVSAPMQDDRHYFYLTFSASLGLNLGNAKVSVPGGTSNTIVIDPFDPYLFVKGDLSKLAGLAPIDDAGIGLSWQGLIPFTPKNTWGVEQQAKTFNGHLWLEGGISLGPKIPLSISGNTVIDVDPNDDGKSVFVDPAGGIQLGANADLALSLGYKKLPISLDIPVASATVVAKLTDQEQWAYFSGKIEPDKTGLPPVIPISFDQSVKVAGYVNSDIEQSFLKAEGSYKINASAIEAWTGIDLSDLGVAQANLTIDNSGVLVTGTATTSFAPVVGLNGNAAVEAFFGGTSTNWYVTLDGQLAVKGIDLSADAHAKLDLTGMFVSGKFQTPHLAHRHERQHHPERRRHPGQGPGDDPDRGGQGGRAVGDRRRSVRHRGRHGRGRVRLRNRHQRCGVRLKDRDQRDPMRQQATSKTEPCAATAT